jgi:hypothetical protein
VNLWEELKKIENLSGETKLKVLLLDGTQLIGQYEGYTSALDNDPAIASIDLNADDGTYELYEDEIKTIETN